MPSNITRPDQQHYVAPLEETPLVAIDTVKAEGKPSNLWTDAWQRRAQAPDVLDLVRAHRARRGRRAVPGPVHAGAAEQRLPARQQQRRPDRRPPARLHQAGLRHLLAHHPRHVDLALGRHHRDRARLRARHRLRCLRGLLRRMARLGALASRRHLLLDPLHPRGRGHHVGALAVRERVGDLARHRHIRVAGDSPRAESRDPQGEERRLRDGGHRPRRLAVPHPAASRAAELDRAGHRHHDDLARVGDRRGGDAVVPRRRPAVEHHVVGQ